MEFGLRQYVASVRTAVLAGAACIGVAAYSADRRELDILGYVEEVRLLDPDIRYKAKLDTGAETSSLSAELIKKFRRDDRRWVRFRLVDPQTGESHIIVRERVRTVAIVQHDGERQIRPVVRVEFCIAGRTVETEVSLIDRSEFAYPLLLGRNTLAPLALVDPAAAHLSRPECGPQKASGDADR